MRAGRRSSGTYGALSPLNGERTDDGRSTKSPTGESRSIAT
jgi:hypothetical protein